MKRYQSSIGLTACCEFNLGAKMRLSWLLPIGTHLLFGLLSLFTCMAASASEVPLRVRDGIYTVRTEINGSTPLEFLVDTGASVVGIPERVFNMLVANGTVTTGDLLGTATATLADRSLYQAVGIKLHDVRIGDVVAHDVVAVVSPGIEYPLLGQTFLSRFGSVTFDNQRHVLIVNQPQTNYVVGSTTTPNQAPPFVGSGSQGQYTPPFYTAYPGASYNVYSGYPGYSSGPPAYPNYGSPGWAYYGYAERN